MIGLNYRALMRQWILPWTGMLVILIGGVLLTEYVAGLAAERVLDSHRREALARLSELRARLEGEINSVLYFTQGLTAYLAFRPDIGAGEFERAAARMLRGSRHVRAIALAPDNVLQLIYPLEGNEQALGLRYETHPTQWPAIKRAIDSGMTTVAGPLALVQGGIGLIARTPIYVDEGKESRYWGIASVVIEVDGLLRAAGAYEAGVPGILAIRGVDGLGAEGAQFFGPEGLFERDDILTQEVTFQQNRWQLGVVPEAPEGLVASMRVRMLAYGLLLIIMVLLLQLARTFRNFERRATRDPLTGLPNRRLLLERAAQLAALGKRGRLDFCLCYVDLNGFKPVNDTYGHHAGDLVLLEVAARLRRVSRAADTVARTGGDEFVLLLPGVSTATEADRVAEKLQQALCEPMAYDSQRIQIGASLGWALFPSEAGDLDELMALADRRMYAMKASRHRVTPVRREVGIG